MKFLSAWCGLVLGVSVVCTIATSVTYAQSVPSFLGTGYASYYDCMYFERYYYGHDTTTSQSNCDTFYFTGTNQTYSGTICSLEKYDDYYGAHLGQIRTLGITHTGYNIYKIYGSIDKKGPMVAQCKSPNSVGGATYYSPSNVTRLATCTANCNSIYDSGYVGLVPLYFEYNLGINIAPLNYINQPAGINALNACLKACEIFPAYSIPSPTCHKWNGDVCLNSCQSQGIYQPSYCINTACKPSTISCSPANKSLCESTCQGGDSSKTTACTLACNSCAYTLEPFTYALEGTIFIDHYPRDTQVNSGEAYLASGVTVNLQWINTDLTRPLTVSGWTTTAVSGAYRFDNLPPSYSGYYVLSYDTNDITSGYLLDQSLPRQSGISSGSHLVEQIIIASGSASTQVIDFSLVPLTGSIKGTVSIDTNKDAARPSSGDTMISGQTLLLSSSLGWTGTIATNHLGEFGQDNLDINDLYTLTLQDMLSGHHLVATFNPLAILSLGAGVMTGTAIDMTQSASGYEMTGMDFVRQANPVVIPPTPPTPTPPALPTPPTGGGGSPILRKDVCPDRNRDGIIDDRDDDSPGYYDKSCGPDIVATGMVLSTGIVFEPTPPVIDTPDPTPVVKPVLRVLKKKIPTDTVAISRPTIKLSELTRTHRVAGQEFEVLDPEKTLVAAHQFLQTGSERVGHTVSAQQLFMGNMLVLVLLALTYVSKGLVIAIREER